MPVAAIAARHLRPVAATAVPLRAALLLVGLRQAAGITVHLPGPLEEDIPPAGATARPATNTGKSVLPVSPPHSPSGGSARASCSFFRQRSCEAAKPNAWPRSRIPKFLMRAFARNGLALRIRTETSHSLIYNGSIRRPWLRLGRRRRSRAGCRLWRLPAFLNHNDILQPIIFILHHYIGFDSIFR